MLEPGSVFAGRYKVIRRLGAGGMGAVYEAEQISTRKHRALKVLTNRFGADEKAQARFVREATVGAEIRSAHIVDVIGAGIDEPTGLPWLAMELLDGMDLKRLVDTRGRLEPAHLLALFSQLGHGLGAAHAAGVVHRDLKPENVFVARSRSAGASFMLKILDFGISKVTHEAVVSTDTATIGSPMWMSPEQINAEPVSARTDVWSLGLLAFWALSGRLYWKAAYGQRVTVQALFAEQLFADIAAPSERAEVYGVAERVPQGFDDWFAQCVRRDPAERFADATAATKALEAVLQPWVAGRAPTRSLLPEPGVPAEASVARSEPVLGPVGGARRSELAEMAGTTADVMSLQGSQPTIAGTAHGTSAAAMRPDVTGTQPPAPPVSVRSEQVRAAPQSPDSTGPGVGKIVALLAIGVTLLGVGAGVAMVWPDDATDDDDAPRVVARQVDDEEAGEEEGEEDHVTAAKLDVGAARPEPPEIGWDGLPQPPQAFPKHAADLSSLPAPTSLEFLGWTPEGEVAVLRVTYGAKTASRGFANYLELIVELDGTTGSVVRTFAVDRVANATLSKNDPLARAEGASVTGTRWVERRTELLLQAPEARRAPSRRKGELTLGFEKVPDGTRVRVQAKRTGFDLGWWGFDELAAGASPPLLHVQWVEGGEARTLMRAPVEVELETLRKLAARPGTDVTLEGPVRVYWTADARRALVTLALEAGRDAVTDRRWFVVEPGGGGARKRIRGESHGR